ncbi:MAG: hypothetical protein RHS_1243 [Robinsoniella sp. RHS]|uniref:RidA family protein n=1 Tax=Robinsoniella sp. RHS TaxID=1504536 RepID=UPI00064AB796|nr:MAG: hypothetical protein RHS_1243 [Robinsoniella sp. RHS]
MIKPEIKEYPNYSISITSADQKQVYIVLRVNAETKRRDYKSICKEMYTEIAFFIEEHKVFIFHERVFGSLALHEVVLQIRKNIYENLQVSSNSPFTYVEGTPYWGEGIAGISIHGIMIDDTDEMRYVSDEEEVCGIFLKNKDYQSLMLHSIHVKDNRLDSYSQTMLMFDRAKRVLEENGFSFTDVVRTWIYLADILAQYDDFNRVRNYKFKEFGLIQSEIETGILEQIYLPASTGIGCNNPFLASGVMDVYAIKPSSDSNYIIRNETGKKQKSAYRYGSAFSRSMVVENEKRKAVYLSGTASINEKGESVFIGDICGQIDETYKVIRDLIQNEDVTFDELCEGTLFIKKADYIHQHEKYVNETGLSQLPLIPIIADICRDDLLFEIDAAFVSNK